MYSRTSHLGGAGLGFLASGWSIQDVLDNYPDLEEEDVYACLAYGAEMARGGFVEVGGPTVEGQA